MIALIKKDRDWLIFFLVAGFITCAAALFNESYRGIWVTPEDLFVDDVFVFVWICAMALGFVAALWEEMTRTQDYLRHRPVTPRQVFSVKVAACFAIVAVWCILPLVIHRMFAGSTQTSEAVDGSRIWNYLCADLAGLSCFAVGAFVGTLPGFFVRRLLLGFPAGFAVVMVSYRLLQADFSGEPSSPAQYLAVQLAMTTLLLVAALKNTEHTADADRPRPMAVIWFSGSCLALGAILSAGIGISQLQNEFYRDLCAMYPQFAQRSDGGFVLVRRKPKDQTEFLLTDEQHRLTGESMPSMGVHRERFRFQRRESVRWRPLWLQTESGSFSGPWSRVKVVPGVHAFLEHRTGKVHVVDARRGSLSTKRFVIGKGEKDIPFSAGSQFIALQGMDGVVIDPSDVGLVWRFALEDGDVVCHAESFPEDDELVSVHRPIYMGRQDELLQESYWMYGSSSSEWITPLRGRKGIYVYDGRRLIRAPEEVASAVEDDPEFEVVVRGRDPITGRMEVVDEEGAVLFGHTYDLFTASEKVCGFAILGASLLRAPVLEVLSYFSDDPVWLRDAVIFDPLLAGRNRPGLLITSVLIGVGLAVFAWIRLRRISGRSMRAREIAWVLFVASGGVVGYVLYRLFETKRAHRRVHVLDPSDAPPLLIRSA